jgi:hypothetical protein
MSTDTRTWTRIGRMTLLLELMGQPAYVYTAFTDPDAAMPAVEEHCGFWLVAGDAEEYWPGGEDSDYPSLDDETDVAVEAFLADYGDGSGYTITVVPVHSYR